MEEISNNSNQKNSILVSRNTPIALVVGVAGFLGSNLADGLLNKGIQVIGADNFSTGKKENLEEATKNKDFHLINKNAQDLSLDLPRLDYIFITAGPDWNLSNVLNIAKKYSSKLVFVSSIELYGKEVEGDLKWYRQAESEIAKFTSENKLNTRVLRLAAVYGPRMKFGQKDPMVKLIYACVTNQLQTHSSSLEFSTRAIFIDDVVSLIIKSMLSGSTAMKIFDGALLVPIKVAEVNQVLMDPVWYEGRLFEPSELPPWPTPNLEKTIKYLSWEAKTPLVKALKTTTEYFQDNIEKEEEPISKLSAFYQQPKLNLPSNVEKPKEEPKKLEEKKQKEVPKKVESVSKNKNKWVTFSSLFTLVAFLIIGYGLIWPLGLLGWNIFTVKNSFTQASVLFSNGDFEESLKEITAVEKGIVGVNEVLSSLGFLTDINIGNLQEDYKTADQLVYISSQAAVSTKHSINGFNSLIKGIKAVTGEINEDPNKYFQQSSEEFAKADSGLSKAQALIDRDQIQEKLPEVVKVEFVKAQEKLISFTSLAQKGRAVVSILPKITAQNGKKSYLVLLQNNNELRPAGGFIGSYARVDFENGKLKKLEVDDIYNIDGKLSIHVDPPKEIKEDLGQKDFFLRDSNWEGDFPTSARQAEWFFVRETGIRVDGVVAMDLSAMEDLLKVSGEISLPEFSEKITSENLFEKSIAHAEQGFFTGTGAKKNFITVLADKLFNQMFFLPGQNWSKMVESFGRSLDQKHLMFYLDDPKLFSYIVSNKWAGALPRPNEKVSEGITDDFLSLVEANLGANKVNYFLDRNYNLETTISKGGEFSHKLKINYTNRSPSTSWPGGNYKNRLRMYLPFGSKLTKATVEGVDITKSVTTFADYGRAGYSLLIEIKPKESKALILEYNPGIKLSFKDKKAVYRLDVIKQAGVIKDPFEWKLNYPTTYTLKSNNSISTDLSVDRRFEAILEK